MRVALYARVSSGRQEKERTIASQLEALRDYAAAHGHEIVPGGEFLDDGFSGAILDRPALDRLRDEAQAGAFEAVLVQSPDRLARNYAYQVLILEELERFGVPVLFLDQPPLDEPTGRLLVQIQAAVAEYERIKIADRNRRGRLYRLRQGEVAVCTVPYGYRRIPRTPAQPAHLVVQEDEAAVVRQIFAWHVEERLSLRGIAQRLQARGVPTPRGAPLWTSQTVRTILRNPAYTGSWAVNRTRITGTGKKALRPPEEWITLSVPPIVDRESFLASQQRHEENRRFSRRRLRDEERWLLRGLLRCGLCGHAVVCRRSPSSNGGFNDYYHCRNRSDTPTPCSAPCIRAPELDAFVWAEVVRTLTHPHLLREAVAGGATLSTDATLLAEQTALLQRRLQATRNERQRLVDGYQAGVLQLPELEPRLARLQLREEEAQLELDRLQRLQQEYGEEKELGDRLDLLAHRLQGEIDTLSFHQRQALLRNVLDTIHVTPFSVTLRYRIPLPPPPPPADGAQPPRVSSKLRLRKDRREPVPEPQVGAPDPAHLPPVGRGHPGPCVL